MSRYIKREDAVFAACKVLHQFGGCKMGPLCPDGGCSEVRDIIDTFPMIEIPEKHGRMIDADSKTFPTLHGNPSNDYMKGWNACLRSVQQQPTIITADKEGEW